MQKGTIGAIILTLLMVSMIVYSLMPKVGTIDDGLKDSKAAQELSQMGIPVTIEELGKYSQGYTVRGQTTYTTDGQILKVALDDDVDPKSYDAEAILYHEMGHAVAITEGTTDDEATADAYAESKGYHIVDAYHGLH